MKSLTTIIEKYMKEFSCIGNGKTKYVNKKKSFNQKSQIIFLTSRV